MPNAKITVEITDCGIDVVLKNWEGVSNVMLEHVHYAIVKESQVHRARLLGAMHAKNMNVAKGIKEAEAAERILNSKLIEEIENVG